MMDGDCKQIFFQEVNSETEIRRAAQKIFSQLRSREVILLIGNLGAGKTFMARELLKLGGVEEPVTSPTFNLIHEFWVGDSLMIHADFYRLNHEGELFDLDIFDNIFQMKQGLVLIEWGERFPSLKREATLEITLELLSGEGRRICAQLYRNI